MREPGGNIDPRAPARRVLIVDRGADTAQSLERNLCQAGFQVSTLGGDEPLATAIRDSNPHLVMLDWDLPGAMAFDLIRNIRQSGADGAPRLIILSALSGDDQIAAGFELGADDYVVKPFSIAEVVARVRAVLRTVDRRHDDTPVLRFHNLELSVDDARVRVGDAVVRLRAMEFRVLEFLMRHPGKAFSRAALLDRVWGDASRAQERAVDVVVQRIRKSLAEHRCEGYLQTIRSVGYRLSVEPERVTAPATDSAPSPATSTGGPAALSTAPFT